LGIINSPSDGPVRISDQPDSLLLDTMSSAAGPSIAALAPGVPNTKRLSTVNKVAVGDNGAAPSPNKGKGAAAGALGPGLAVKEVVSPGELCGFVSVATSASARRHRY
jgi:hypothetical protein